MLVRRSALKATILIISDVITITLVPCGLVVENKPECVTTFCENGRNEVFQLIANKAGVSLEEIKKSIETSAQTQQGPQRIFYRKVAGSERGGDQHFIPNSPNNTCMDSSVNS